MLIICGINLQATWVCVIYMFFIHENREKAKSTDIQQLHRKKQLFIKMHEEEEKKNEVAFASFETTVYDSRRQIHSFNVVPTLSFCSSFFFFFCCPCYIKCVYFMCKTVFEIIFFTRSVRSYAKYCIHFTSLI